VPLDQVGTNQGGVTGTQRPGHGELVFQLVHSFFIVHSRFEAGGFHMVYPFTAAAARFAFVDSDGSST
jgi:hypothetical protein